LPDTAPRPAALVVAAAAASGPGLSGWAAGSLMLTLFRVLELSEGSISIDGVDIAELGLSQLRKAIAMLPQDPVRPPMW
jgi:ABC-type multidrug transport system fused ATPase/permease subunit